MKKALLVLIVLTICVSCQKKEETANTAFGTFKGMTKKDLESKGIELKPVWTGSSLSSKEAPVKNDSFSEYFYFFDENDKLCSISATTETQVNTSPDNLAYYLNAKINFLTNLLSKKYGNPETINKTSLEERNSEWITVLSKDNMNKNSYFIRWTNKEKPLGNNLYGIALRPVVLPPYKNTYSGALIIEYHYKNCTPVSQEKKQFEENSKGL